MTATLIRDKALSALGVGTEAAKPLEIVERDRVANTITVQVGSGADATRVDIKGVPASGAYFARRVAG